MKIDRARLVALFLELGFKVAHTWDNDRMAGKAKQLPKTIDEETRPTTTEGEETLKEVENALKKGEDIEVVGDMDAVPATKKKGGAKVATATKEKAKKGGGEKKSTATPLNRFGAREGTNRAKIDAALSDKGQTVEQIMKKSGQTKEWVRFRIKTLADKGFLTVDKEGKAALKKGK